jgi:hypothetical protein
MKNYLMLLVFFNLFFSLVQAQNRFETFKNHYSIEVGQSKSGTGDQGGIFIANVFTKQFRTKSYYSISLAASIHQDKGALLYTAANGERVDGTLRQITAGIQLSGNYGFSIIKSTKHDIGFSAGAVLRYQTTSINDEVTGFYPSLNGYGPGFFENYPYALLSIVNTEPQETIAIGPTLNLFYNYNISKRILIGIIPGFQFDTNGDTFKNISLKTGYRF